MTRMSVVTSALPLAMLAPEKALACATCIAWLKDRPLWDSGFFMSTLLIMAMPFAIAGVIGGWLLYIHRHSYKNVKREG